MNTYIIRCESGVMDFEVRSTSLATLTRTLNLKNVTEIRQITVSQGIISIWRHPSYMPYEF